MKYRHQPISFELASFLVAASQRESLSAYAGRTAAVEALQDFATETNWYVNRKVWVRPDDPIRLAQYAITSLPILAAVGTLRDQHDHTEKMSAAQALANFANAAS